MITECNRIWTVFFYLFRFPIGNPVLLKKWILATKRKDFTPKKHTRLCSKHFNEDDFYREWPHSQRRVLKCDAVPTLFDFPSHLQHSHPKKRRFINRNQVSLHITSITNIFATSFVFVVWFLFTFFCHDCTILLFCLILYLSLKRALYLSFKSK